MKKLRFYDESRKRRNQREKKLCSYFNLFTTTTNLINIENGLTWTLNFVVGINCINLRKVDIAWECVWLVFTDWAEKHHSVAEMLHCSQRFCGKLHQCWLSRRTYNIDFIILGSDIIWQSISFTPCSFICILFKNVLKI